MKTKYKVLIALLVILVGMQFFGPKKNISAQTPETDFIKSIKPSQEMANLINVSCYDCHSNNTKYPWYNNISPISYWMSSHVNEAKEHLNFSEWGLYPKDKKVKLLEEIREEVQSREMPLNSYTILHSNAKLSDDQIFEVLEWIDKLKKNYQSKRK
jgi:hypothetical protein